MCYYNGTKVTRQEFIRLKHLEKLVANYKFLDNPMHNGFVYGNVPVMKRIEGKEDIDIVEMEWGLIPDANKFPYIETREQVRKFRERYTTLNAVSEELLLKNKMYRDAALHRRCLALSTGFYDYRHEAKMGKKGQPLKATETFPYRVGLNGSEVFYLAAIWQPWTDAETGEYVESMSIVTTVSNSIMSQIHNVKKRMPTILTEDLAWEWLFGDCSEQRITEIAGFQIPSSAMKAYTIDKQFRTAEDPLIPCEYKQLPSLVLE
jgi:putative SOS response-associated peptidase YedK